MGGSCWHLKLLKEFWRGRGRRGWGMSLHFPQNSDVSGGSEWNPKTLDLRLFKDWHSFHAGREEDGRTGNVARAYECLLGSKAEFSGIDSQITTILQSGLGTWIFPLEAAPAVEEAPVSLCSAKGSLRHPSTETMTPKRKSSHGPVCPILAILFRKRGGLFVAAAWGWRRLSEGGHPPPRHSGG